MLPTDDAHRADACYTVPEHLRIGLYVYLDLPWFRHPFTLNSFKISSDAQIRELRALDSRRFRFDPERSDPVPGGASAAPPPGPDAPASAAANGDDPEPATAPLDARARRLLEYRKVVARTERSFLKAVGITRRLDKDLLAQPREVLEEMGGLVEQMAGVFLERPEVTLHLMGDNCGGEEVYHHGLNVSVLCMMLAKGLKLSGDQAGILGMGALLHDLGLREIPDRVVKKGSREQTGPERELRARHVEYGVNAGARLALAPDTLTIIEQHHEFADGSGYPRGLRLEQIAPLARVVSLVNFYENLCNPVDFSEAVTPHQALSQMYAQHRNKFDARVLQLMIRSLGVYPPGSIVRLSNEALAIVVTVNPHKPLRPWVLLYDAAIPRERAEMLDLETERNLGICKSIRPAHLPALVRAYLSARRRITYFFDGGLPDSGGRRWVP